MFDDHYRFRVLVSVTGRPLSLAEYTHGQSCILVHSLVKVLYLIWHLKFAAVDSLVDTDMRA